MNFPKTQQNQRNCNNINTEKISKTNSSKNINEKSLKKDKNLNSTQKQKSSSIIKKNINKKPLPTWKKLEFPISQLTGKIKNNYKKKDLPKNIDKEDIDIILKLITKESKKFSPVKNKTKLTFIFILLIV